jgi:hypothetical protein
MKKTNFFYHLLIGLGLCGLVYCGDGGDRNNSGAQGYDSTTAHDSTSSVHHVDPANAYPQPPVTGSNQDSSRTKDSANKPKY